MNRTPLKRYAPLARRQFRQAITDKAALIGLSPTGNLPIRVEGDYAIVGGRPFLRSFAQQRAKLEKWIERDGFETVVDEVAYTWFNRLMAIRFMEVNGYLSHGFKVLGHAEGRNQPQILVEAENINFPGLDTAQVTQLKIDGNRDEELYRLLLLEQCHELHSAMPWLFERISDESELLLPETLLQTDSIVSTLVSEIPEELWQEIEIIGWLYQFYISERKDEVIGKVVASADIPAATQLFTPNWIVKYMTHNSLGRQWLATYPDSPLRAQMEYYIEPARQSEEVLESLRAQTPDTLDPEALTLLDPACGSGHILVEAYELFKAMYLERGYRLREIPRLILENNLFGLDIDPRAAQMAGFAVLMKGRADDRRLLDDPPHVQIYALRDSSGLDATELVQALVSSASFLEQSPLEADIAAVLDFYEGAETFGSLLQVPVTLEARIPRLRAALEATDNVDLLVNEAKIALQPLILQSEILVKNYDCVVANPPYMGSKYQTPKLKNFLKKNFEGFEKDLFSAFIVRCLAITKNNGHLAFMSPFVWMFLKSYERLRENLIAEQSLTTLIHPEYHSFFESAYVPICSFTIRKSALNYKSTFFDLTSIYGAEEQAAALVSAIQSPVPIYRNVVLQRRFEKLPNRPIAYWISEKIADVFTHSKPLEVLLATRLGMSTADNERFLRFWPEVSQSKIYSGDTSLKSSKWFPYQKGGAFRKWYGNLDMVVNWEDNGREVRNNKDTSGKVRSHNYNESFAFRKGVTWSDVTSAQNAFRYMPEGFMFDGRGSSGFCNSDADIFTCISLLNSKVSTVCIAAVNPTIALNVGEVAKIPLHESVQAIAGDVGKIAQEAISISRADWDSFETSWDFGRSPLLDDDTLEGAFESWKAKTIALRARLSELEIENNRLFIRAYGLEDELSPDVPDEQITLSRADREGDIKRLISYGIGCLMGRYSLDEPGLVFAGAGGEGFNPERYKTLPADADGILPVMDTHWFGDDLVSRLEEFLRAAYGPENFIANIAFLAQNLGQKMGEDPEDTLRRYLVNDFYRDHLRTYRNRPIYWLFSSGKEKAFSALVYLHRFNAATLSRLREDYVVPLLGRYPSRIASLALDVQNLTSPAARKIAEKERVKRQKQLLELQTFDEKLRHRIDERFSLDLDDGVPFNYVKFADLLAEVRLVTGGASE